LLPFFLPPDFESLVKEGDSVKEGQVLAQNTKPAEISINISKDLGIPIRKTRNVIKKNVGDKIAIGDLLAEKKGFLGGAVIKSTMEGTYSKFDEETGSMVISITGASENKEILSPVDGEVSMCNNEKILLKTGKEALALEEGTGETFVGEILKLKSGDSRDLNVSVDGKIVFSPKIERESLFKAIVLGAGAVLAEEVEDLVFESLRDKNVKTPVGRIKGKDLDRFLKTNVKVMVDGSKKIILKV